MSNHATLGPSGAERWMNCTASIRATQEFIKKTGWVDVSSVYADTGTLAHSMMEVALVHNLNPEVGFKDMQKYIKKYVDYVNYIRKGKEEDYKVHIEQRVKLSKDLWGTADTVMYHKGHLHIIDLKYGRSKVMPKENKQLMIYAAATIKTLYPNTKKVTLHIVQPRINNFSEWSVSVKDIKRLKKLAVKQGKKALSGKGAKYKYSSKHCFFCPVKYECRAYEVGSNPFSDTTTKD